MADKPASQKHHVVGSEPYNWPHDGSFTRESTALVLVDMQRDWYFLLHEACCKGGYLDKQGFDGSLSQALALIPKLQCVLNAFRQHHFQVYHTREGHRPDLSTLNDRELVRSRNNPSGIGVGDEAPLGRLLIRGEKGHDTIPELYPVHGEPVIDKPGKGIFGYTDFDLLLRNRGIRNLVIGGVTTDVCVSTIMREANDRGYDCLLLEDGCTAMHEGLHKSTLASVKMEGGVFGAVASVDDVVRSLSFD